MIDILAYISAHLIYNPTVILHPVKKEEEELVQLRDLFGKNLIELSLKKYFCSVRFPTMSTSKSTVKMYLFDIGFHGMFIFRSQEDKA